MKITVDGVALDVSEVGSGRPLVLVHGFTGSQDDWMDHVGWLAEQYRVITYDHRGHGASAHAGPYTLARLTADLDAVLMSLDAFPAILLGHSMGGVVVQNLAVANPERVIALILMDTWPGGRLRVADTQRDLLRMSAEVARRRGMKAVAKLRGKFEAGAQPGSAAARLSRQRPDVAALNESRFAAMDPEAFAGLVLEGLDGASGDLLSALTGLSKPVLVMAGEEDEPFLAATRRYEAELPAGTVVWIDDAGHSPQFEAPAAWRSAVGAFLSGLR